MCKRIEGSLLFFAQTMSIPTKSNCIEWAMNHSPLLFISCEISLLIPPQVFKQKCYHCSTTETYFDLNSFDSKVKSLNTFCHHEVLFGRLLCSDADLAFGIWVQAFHLWPYFESTHWLWQKCPPWMQKGLI